MNYVLDDKGNPRVEPDVIAWAKWFEQTENRTVAKDQVGSFRISTVFLGIDDQFSKGPPLLFESRRFPLDSFAGEECERYATREEAEKGHAAMVERTRQLEQKERQYDRN